MLHTLQALKKENIVNIKELQKSPSKHLKSITRVLRGKKTLGFFLQAKDFENFVEDLEAISSKNYKKSIGHSRKRKTYTSLKDVEKIYGII